MEWSEVSSFQNAGRTKTAKHILFKCVHSPLAGKPQNNIKQQTQSKQCAPSVPCDPGSIKVFLLHLCHTHYDLKAAGCGAGAMRFLLGLENSLSDSNVCEMKAGCVYTLIFIKWSQHLTKFRWAEVSDMHNAYKLQTLSTPIALWHMQAKSATQTISLHATLAAS